MSTEAETTWPILIVEDDAPTAELEARVLRRSGRASRIVARADEAIAALRAERYSSVLLDYLLADENGWSVLEIAQKSQPPVPVIVVTGKGNEVVAMEALRLGAADYVIKNGDFWEQLPNIVERIEKSAEAERLRQSLASVLQDSDDAIVGNTLEGTVVSWNAAAARIFQISASEAIGTPLTDLYVPERRSEITRAVAQVGRGERTHHFETSGRRADGSSVFLSVAFAPSTSATGAVTGVTVVARDISDRKRTEEQLRRAEHQLQLLQKYEAIRQIAGGVAHEFNNLLTVMIVRGELMKNTLQPGNPMRSELDVIVKTGERAATVARQLLAFSRQQFLRPKEINLNASVTEIQNTLKHMVGGSIQLTLNLAPDLDLVRADPVKIDEVIINLVVNAKESMPDGGKIGFETKNFSTDKARNPHEGLKPGRYAMLAVTDTGCGMDSATLARVFEPFFTTKGRAKRTGLGLAVVYGTIKQSDGFIFASSKPGAGSRFEIYLPLVDTAPLEAHPTAASTPEPPCTTVLIVEDESFVLELVAEILGSAGYNLLTASSPSEAITLAEKFAGTIDLLLTDVIMPEMNGPELAIRLSALKPGLRVLYMSGYPENNLGFTGRTEVEFISKPFTIESLKRKVSEALKRK